jgi:transaldolase
MPDPLEELTAAGVSVWLGDLSRPLLTAGTLNRLVEDGHVVGITSNPTIFANAIRGSTDYDEQIRELGRRHVPTADALRVLTVTDIRSACDVLRPVYDATHGVDGRVSIEVDPRLAHDAAEAITEARQLWRLVDKPNLFIKIPATEAGLPAIAQCLAEGISINVTLIFSLQRYAAVIETFLEGMERALAAGRDLSTLASVASFFVSRVDTEIDKRLDHLATPEARALKGKAAIANARLAYEYYERVFTLDRWGALAAAGAQPQRPPVRSRSGRCGHRPVSRTRPMTTPDMWSTLSPRAWSTPCRKRLWRRWPSTAPSGATASDRSTQTRIRCFAILPRSESTTTTSYRALKPMASPNSNRPGL